MPSHVVRDYLDKVRTSLDQGEECLERSDYSTSIQRVSECIELSLKAVIRLVTSESPSRDHNVSGDLESCLDKFPEWFKERTARFALLSRITSTLRIFAIYGYEAMNAPAKGLFSQYEAKAYIEGAKEILRDCERLYLEEQEKKGSMP